MSAAWMIAFGIAFIAGGSAGFERQMQEGNKSAAGFESFVIIGGIVLLAFGIDGLAP